MPEHRRTKANLEAGFVRLKEIAAILDLSGERCRQLAEQADFPEPVKFEGGSRWWPRIDIQAWAIVNGYPRWPLRP